MTRGASFKPDEWSRLEALWETARGLPPAERDAMLASHSIDGALREEFESLLGRANAAEAFFDRLLTAVPHANHALTDQFAAIAPSASTGADVDPMLGTTVAHYEIVARLGQGGMGVVYRAIDLRLRRTVAIKLLRSHTHTNQRAKERLLIEARAAAALDHANISTIYEVGETAEQRTYIAMAYYSGETLERVMQRGPLSVPVALDYATQIARGLSAAHQRGIIHRDVKPANVIVTEDGVVKLLDFGIAQFADVDVSHEGVTPGTIAYMSPEQVSARPVDARTDLWSLGVVVYEMLTGVRPFSGDNAAAILYAILHHSPAPTSTLCPELPPSVDAIVERLLTKERAQRYDDAEQLIADLAPLSAATDTAPRTIRPGRRLSRRVVWYGAALIAVGAVIASLRGAPPRTVSDRRLAAEDLTAQGKRDVLFRSADGRRQSLEFFRKAIAVDSTYAGAHSSLSHLLVMTAEDGHGSRHDHFVQAEKSARTAIGLDSALADGHAALGHVLMIDYQAAKAEEQFKRALELNPVEPYVREFLVWLYIFTDRPRDALEQAELAAKDSPKSPTAIAEVARALIVNGRCDEALEILGQLAYLQPPPARAAAIAAQCYAQRGMWQKAIDELRPVAARNPVQTEPWLGFMLARAGAMTEAQQLRDSLLARAKRTDGGAFGMVVIYTGFRDFDNAFDWLDRSIDERSLRYNIMEPAFEELRRDPRFDRVRARLGIQQR